MAFLTALYEVGAMCLFPYQFRASASRSMRKLNVGVYLPVHLILVLSDHTCQSSLATAGHLDGMLTFGPAVWSWRHRMPRHSLQERETRAQRLLNHRPFLGPRTRQRPVAPQKWRLYRLRKYIQQSRYANLVYRSQVWSLKF
jgi:hypothetical protein